MIKIIHIFAAFASLSLFTPANAASRSFEECELRRSYDLVDVSLYLRHAGHACLVERFFKKSHKTRRIELGKNEDNLLICGSIEDETNYIWRREGAYQAIGLAGDFDFEQKGRTATLLVARCVLLNR